MSLTPFYVHLVQRNHGVDIGPAFVSLYVENKDSSVASLEFLSCPQVENISAIVPLVVQVAVRIGRNLDREAEESC